MRNQNDLIFSIVAVVLAVIVSAVLYATKPDVPPPVAVTPIDTTPAALPQGDVAMANSLPNAAQAQGGGGGGGGGGKPNARGAL